MPRPPSVSHPLRTARQILGLSQSAFGAQVGVSGITIQQIENRLMQMSRGLAQKISITYGLDPDQLMAGTEAQQPRFTDGTPFSRQEYEMRKLAPRDVDDRKTVDSHVANFTFALEALLDAANETRRYGPFSNALQKRLRDLVEEFELHDTLSKIFKDYGADLSSGMTLIRFSFGGRKETDCSKTGTGFGRGAMESERTRRRWCLWEILFR